MFVFYVLWTIFEPRVKNRFKLNLLVVSTVDYSKATFLLVFVFYWALMKQRRFNVDSTS